MKVGCAQFDCQFGAKEHNLKKIEFLANQSRSDLLVFPEMATTGYMVAGRDELRKIAEPVPEGVSVQRLKVIAKLTNKLLIVGLPEIDRDKLYDSAVAVGPRGYITKYQKTHRFLKEKLYFDPSETKSPVFEWRGARIGVGICYDYMFPEYWRSLALQGADIFCNTANFVFNYGFTLMRARALENGIFSLCTNRVGVERGQRFTGGSEVVDTRGQIIKKARDREEILDVEINLSLARNKQWNEYNDLISDRRPEMYSL